MCDCFLRSFCKNTIINLNISVFCHKFPYLCLKFRKKSLLQPLIHGYLHFKPYFVPFVQSATRGDYAISTWQIKHYCFSLFAVCRGRGIHVAP